MSDKLTPLQAIKAYCKECCGDDSPTRCTIIRCSLHPFRLGKNPYLGQHPLSEKQRAHLFKKKQPELTE
ncbi:MAG: hypothetical protein ACI4OR_02460 [Alphaproteobacteria bacterium]